MMTKRPGKTTKSKEVHLSRVRLDELVAEALVDSNSEWEQAIGFYIMLENDLKLPFEAQIIGVTATVERVDIPMMTNWSPFAGRAKHGNGSRSRNCRYPRRRQKGPSGLSRIGTGEPVPPDEHTGAEPFGNSPFVRLPLTFG